MLDLGTIAKLDRLLGPAKGILACRCPWCGTRLALRVEPDAGRVVCARCGREGDLAAILAEVERRELRKRRERIIESREFAEMERLMQQLPRGAPRIVRAARGGGKTTRGGGESGC